MTNTTLNLRDQISRDISRAIDSTVNYSGKEYDLNRHNWVQITTDRAIAAVMASLPEPVDISSKYETTKEGGVYINIGADESDEHNDKQLIYLANYQSDQGWNHYFMAYTSYLRGLYKTDSAVVQSEYEEYNEEDNGPQGRTQQEDGDTPNDSEPSKVR